MVGSCKKRPQSKPERRAKKARARHEEPTLYPMSNIFHLPWSLRFDRNGTDDIADICQGRGTCILATSRGFWRPEYKGDKVPGTMASMRLMATAPKLLQALHILLAQTANANASGDHTRGLRQARATALRIIAEALYPAEELDCDNHEHETGAHWLGGPALPYDIGGLR